MTSAPRHRHSIEGGYPRGEETRARIVSAALKLFGERGYEGASTRDIAAAAGVNAPALQYYFDGKEGVYIACVEHIVSFVWEHMGEVVGRAESLLSSGADDEALIEAYCNIQTDMVQFMFTAKDAMDWKLFMARQQAGGGPVAGFQLAYQGMTQRLHGTTAAIVGRLIGRPATDEESLMRAIAISGQLTVFQVARRSVLTSLNIEAIDAPRIALLQRIVREHTETLLRSMRRSRY